MARELHILVLLAILALAGVGPSVPQHKAANTILLPANPHSFPRDRASPVAPLDASLRRAPFHGPIDAQLTRIIDGDTFEARIRVWFGQEITTLVRVRGMDAPEIRSHCAAEAQGAQDASAALAELLATGHIELRDVTLDKYGGRVVASVMVSDPAFAGEPAEDIASLMLARGIVRVYSGGDANHGAG